MTTLPGCGLHSVAGMDAMLAVGVTLCSQLLSDIFAFKHQQCWCSLLCALVTKGILVFVMLNKYDSSTSLQLATCTVSNYQDHFVGKGLLQNYNIQPLQNYVLNQWPDKPLSSKTDKRWWHKLTKEQLYKFKIAHLSFNFSSYSHSIKNGDLLEETSKQSKYRK